MDSIRRSLVLLAFLWVLSAYAQSPPSIAPAAAPAFSISAARSLDALLQDYAYRAFVRPRTAVPYDASVPPNITGITLSVIRFRSGSLRLRGVARLKEFEIPKGVIETPWVERLALVYQNLGNWSSFYYGLPGYTFLSPVLGLLAYDARNLSATNLSELSFVTSRKPILIHFQNVKSPIDGSTPRCVWFNLEGLPELKDLESGEFNSCSTTQQGHFSIVVNSTAPLAPAPSERPPTPGFGPSEKKSSSKKVWKIVGIVVGSFLFLVLLGSFIAWMWRHHEKKELTTMADRSEQGEPLGRRTIGGSPMPLAGASQRTLPEPPED
ncbi:hypothetical protein QJS10_CPB20g00054 [Acorus calamus]|uniref:Transmembrane protein n=1 Tax=Acorus calamus TaxID=4465 RepID=A0AAV9CBJ3_ACOCL|nr:hypothetical protein QJS10_CPB20g00054 [Acorus calamus]